MKLILLSLLFAFPSFAVTVRVVGPQNSVMMETQVQSELPTHLGIVTVNAFDQESLKYEGGPYGITKINELGGKMEVLSDTEMKAYGWCFSIDGLVPETMADETEVTSPDSVIVWFYAYAHYKDGQWIGQCVPADQTR